MTLLQFEEDGELGGALVDVVVAVSMTTGALVPTIAGDSYFSLWEQLGTTSQVSRQQERLHAFIPITTDFQNMPHFFGLLWLFFIEA